jgi:hypothetical protein
MTLSDVEICSVALVKIGASAIASFDEDSVEADIAGRLYEMTVSALLASHPWHFTITEVDLEIADAPPQAGFAHAFLLPDDQVRILSAGASPHGRGLAYRIAGSLLHADSTKVVLTYQRRPDTATFPAFFVQALVARLAAELCLPLTEGTSRADALYKLASAELKIARLIDSQQSTPRAVEDFTLIAARSR